MVLWLSKYVKEDDLFLCWWSTLLKRQAILNDFPNPAVFGYWFVRHAVFLVFLRCFLLESGESSPKHFSQLWAHQKWPYYCPYHVFDFPQQTTGFFGRFQLGHHSKGLVEATILIRMVKLPDFQIKKNNIQLNSAFFKGKDPANFFRCSNRKLLVDRSIPRQKQIGSHRKLGRVHHQHLENHIFNYPPKRYWKWCPPNKRDHL